LEAPLAIRSGPRLEHYLLGRSRAAGLFQDFSGAVRRRFDIDIHGWRDGDTLVVDETFLFDDGAVDERRWRIVIEPSGAHRATAGDMIGEARGQARNDVLRWSYLFSLQIGRRRWRVRFHDSFVELSDQFLLNRARVSKFGLPIGQVTILFARAVA
jgi:hypothetical protein